MHKIQDIDCFVPETLMIKQSCSPISQKHAWVDNAKNKQIKTCYLSLDAIFTISMKESKTLAISF